MASCVIYARVSTKDQQEEGYSIPAQLSACRKFALESGLAIETEFVETESAGRSGRKEFGRMLNYFEEHPNARTLIAHKLDRLYRNYPDQDKLEQKLGVRVRYVLGDFPKGPQGELLRDIQLGIAKYYLGNLREEVIKGMDEKAAQGGWPHKAPIGYLNDRTARTIVPDPDRAILIRRLFERYATGSVSLSDIAAEMYSSGLTSRTGRKIYPSLVHQMLRNPIYCGLIRHKGKVYPGNHSPIISVSLFEKVQTMFEPKRNGAKSKHHVFELRDYLVCGVCGCKITAERQKGHVYYRCTKGKGADACTQRKYTREESLVRQVSAILSRIEISEELVLALADDAQRLNDDELAAVRAQSTLHHQKISGLAAKKERLLDAYLDGVVSDADYRSKTDALDSELLTFELEAKKLSEVKNATFEQVEILARAASKARIAYETGDLEAKREILANVVSNLVLVDQQIVSYQLKEPFSFLEKDSDDALIHDWWAILDLNQ